MNTNKKNAIKKLLKITEAEFKNITDKVLEDWANNVISTKYREVKTTDEIVDEINET